MKARDILPLLLLLVALALAPVRLLGGEAAAMAHHAAAPTAIAHCAPDEAPADDSERPFSKAACSMACAALAPAVSAAGERLPIRVAPDQVAAPGLAGLTPEAATPPPRSA